MNASRMPWVRTTLAGLAIMVLQAPAATPTIQAGTGSSPRAVVPDSFPHNRHDTLACLTCHVVKGSPRKLVFEQPRGCDLCHHQAAASGRLAMAECGACHKKILQPPAPPVLTGDRPTRRRFSHDRHGTTACATCHVFPSFVPAKEQAACTACHEDHHAAQRNCAECHRSPNLADAHARETHRACDECHDPATVAALVPDRGFCLTCHEPQRGHQANGECTTCHFLATPAEYRRRIGRRVGG